MKVTTTGTLTPDEIRAAVKLWLHQVKGIEASSVSFDITYVNDSDAWGSGSYPVLGGASFITKETP